MKINHISLNEVEITLSERNLLALLGKLRGYPKRSFATLEKLETIDRITLGKDEENVRLIVKAETDAEHYKNRAPAGEMHKETEKFVRKFIPKNALKI